MGDEHPRPRDVDQWHMGQNIKIPLPTVEQVEWGIKLKLRASTIRKSWLWFANPCTTFSIRPLLPYTKLKFIALYYHILCHFSVSTNSWRINTVCFYMF